MPNKTIYVSDADLPLLQRAQELTGGNMSSAIVEALRRLVDVEEGKREGFQEVVVRVGPGEGRRQRFVGVLLVEWGRSTKDRVEEFRVYRGRSGKFVVHTTKSPETSWTAGANGSAQGWRKYLSSDQQWSTTAATATLDIADDLDALREVIPPELFALVSDATADPVVEDLDI
ncbi:EXLDI protein [Rhodococcus sp. Eu-32]|uniref:EXLDI protein n=1 Tax=Rhodococcus sp. Eu-32 TaxID=1017319 RepID=UPI000DF26B5B|nr:EXLDI protein [Rhodococcus sp. Eu-32]RRQ28355.1 EXLDI protein [Rhodococcus sp. Eu-32]